MLSYPHIDPIAIQLGPIAIRWYALAYITGLTLGWLYIKRLVRFPPHAMRELDVDDFLVWAALGVVLGGRLGYVLFYKPVYYFHHPLEIFQVWHGGMAFHGGALGVIVAIIVFARRRGLNLFAIGDVVCCAVPIGLFFGRIANFINGELFGRVAPNAPFAMIFPGGGPEPRHPSQLYEAGMEGLILFLLLAALWRVRSFRQHRGALSGTFLIGYGTARIVGEFFRQPDAHLGFLMGGATMGQLLSIPLLLAGAGVIAWAFKYGHRP